MTTKDFKEQWPLLKGKKVNVTYGKQKFRAITLIEYDEKLATVKTAMKGELNTRAIKHIQLIEEPGTVEEIVEYVNNDFVEHVSEEVVVTPKLPFNWDRDGYFLIYGTLGGHWKNAKYLDDEKNVKRQSESSFKHQDLFNWIIAQKQADKEDLLPDYIVDDTFVAPEYYHINKHLSINKIIS